MSCREAKPLPPLYPFYGARLSLTWADAKRTARINMGPKIQGPEIDHASRARLRAGRLQSLLALGFAMPRPDPSTQD